MSSPAENGGAEGMEAMLGNVLEVLGQNPELMELAGKLAGLSEMTAGQSETSENAEPSAAEDKFPLAGFNALFGGSGSEEGRDSVKTVEKIPKPEKPSDPTARAVALLKALRPFMNEERGESVERLLKVLPTAKTIRAALHAFGSL